ncbi:MAG: hypothetical protein KC414_05495 [Romboutsia sp.]|nr:hypothetical protein [Romboutsia sp.]
MGTYKETNGNLLDLADSGKFQIIGHGANCFSTMGGGIAAQIRQRYPMAYTMDVKDRRPSIQKLGDFSVASIMGELLVINIYSQYELGRNLDYEALTLALRKINRLYKGMSIGLPYVIGCGIAGGDIDTVIGIIKRELCDMDVTLVKYEQ